ncbi:helix-turn-helix domain-containing protein [Rhodococcus sp. Leaf233]|uniref:helix-turn-helix domain-containing protein n=1 Tax=Rhodococcus sp. Leaf233 TaxID=1736302 RepID=UPI00070FEC3E|nr:helix-turn-helix transcriptional regulator [Rhodococcus sp. Leaf233]KQU33525.1 hypothetical protein ASH04_06720 [Rhodococcus sp. Leaf233]
MKLKSPELLRAFVGPEDSKKMSARKLARYADVHPSFIDHLLAARRRSCEPLTAARIAEALEVPIAILFDVQVSTTAQRSGNAKAKSTVAA